MLNEALCHELLCLCLVCNVISSSGLECYTYVWIALLYLCLDWKFIPRSGFLYYTYFWFFQIWFQAFIPTSGLQYYTYICYGYFCFCQIGFKTCYTYVRYRKNGYYTIVRYIYLWRPELASVSAEPLSDGPTATVSRAPLARLHHS